MTSANYWIDRLNLLPHPEGGFYRQTFQSSDQINLDKNRTRSISSSILFLLTASSPSHFHRLKSEEIWFYHAGHSLTIHLLHPDGTYETVALGLNEGEQLQYTVPRNVIFGSSVISTTPQAFSLVSCVVAPGFDFTDFELFTQAELLEKFPTHETIIKQLAYQK